MFIYEISITVILVYQKFESVGPVQQKTKLPSPQIWFYIPLAKITSMALI